MSGRTNNIGDEAAAAQYNRMMNQKNYQRMPFNPILHKFNSKNVVSATKEARDKKTSWKNRNFLKVKVDDLGGRIYNEADVPAAIKYMTPDEIKWKNIESAYNPIKFDSNSSHVKRTASDNTRSQLVLDKKYRDSKVMNEYAREVSKRVRILKDKDNKYFARYNFEERLKQNEDQRNTSIENSYK